MGEETKIAWCDHTRNPWIGCTKATYLGAAGRAVIHPACVHCYAEKLSLFRGWAKWGRGMVRRIKAKAAWNQPLGWALKAALAGVRRTVFLLSLGDILDEEMDRQPAMREAFDREMELIRATHHVCRLCGFGKHQTRPATRKQLACRVKGHQFTGGLTYLLLTKRPERWPLIPEDVRRMVWFGTSASDQPTWDRWVSVLMGAVGFGGLFVSVEPQVAPIDFGFARLHLGAARIGKVILGGESGPSARVYRLEWPRSGLAQCRAAGVACFVKQLGRKPLSVADRISHARCVEPLGVLGFYRFLNHPAGEDSTEWPVDVRVRDSWPTLASEIG